jgi:hypothetical protein
MNHDQQGIQSIFDELTEKLPMVRGRLNVVRERTHANGADLARELRMAVLPVCVSAKAEVRTDGFRVLERIDEKWYVKGTESETEARQLARKCCERILSHGREVFMMRLHPQRYIRSVLPTQAMYMERILYCIEADPMYDASRHFPRDIHHMVGMWRDYLDFTGEDEPQIERACRLVCDTLDTFYPGSGKKDPDPDRMVLIEANQTMVLRYTRYAHFKAAFQKRTVLDVFFEHEVGGCRERLKRLEEDAPTLIKRWKELIRPVPRQVPDHG